MGSTQPSLTLAVQAALAAGADIMAMYDSPTADFGIERKADSSPLTRADKAAHERILSFLEPTGIPVLSEEGADIPYEERRTWQRLWVVDPLDGTKEFIKRNGEFTVNIALVENGIPTMGVIYAPATGVLYSGMPLYYGRPGSAYRQLMSENTIERLPNFKKPRPFTVVASRSHLSPETEAFVADLKRKHPYLKLVNSGSSLKICLVAEGFADVYPRLAPTMEWDTAAGDAIARAAGCEVVDAETGLPLTYNKEDLHNPWFVVRRTALP